MENTIENEYQIPIEKAMREDVNMMCNLSQGIKEEGIAQGEAMIILKMFQKGLSIEHIAAVTDKEVDEIKAIVGEKK